MGYNPAIHHRRSIRLKGYDYAQASLYFVTICVLDRENLFGEIRFDLLENESGMRDGATTRVARTTRQEMVLNDAGKMIEKEWLAIAERFPNIILHEFVIMPNHFHAIIQINVGAPLVVAPNIPDPNYSPNIPDQNKHTLGNIIAAFKSKSTIAYINGVKTKNWPEFKVKLWQRNYWEHIIRDERAYFNISKYIKNNPKTGVQIN